MSQGQISGIRCLVCRSSVPARAKVGLCPDCGEAGLLDLAYDLDDAARTLDRPSLERREPWMWRYRELLPMDELAELPPLQVGMTPVYGVPRLALRLGLPGLWLKDEGRSPTRSVWDRAGLLSALMARERGIEVLAVSGDGAAVRAAACAAAALGLRSAAFARLAPASSSVFGAAVFTSGSGARDRELCREAAARFGWADASEAAAPYAVDGFKTIALEIAEQLIERLPDWIAIPASPPSLAVAVAKGLREMEGLRLIRSRPRLLTASLDSEAEESHPGAARAASEALRELDGAAVEIGRDGALDAARWAAADAGVESSPAGAAALAGLARAIEQGIVPKSSTALVVLAGGMNRLTEATEIGAPDVDSVASAARALGLIS